METESKKLTIQEHDKDIQSKDHLYSEDKEKCIFYFTGSTIDHLLKGINIELHLSIGPNECQNELQQILLANNIDLTGKQLLIYLPGGIPFISGTLAELYTNKSFTTKKVIYGVITRHIEETILNESILNICNISDPHSRLLVSPLYDSTELGLSDMACLLGYLRYNGLKSDLFYATVSTVINFPPLITSMCNILEGIQVFGRDIVTFCSSLFTYFRGNLPHSILNDRVFEYALRICNLITKIEVPRETLPILNINIITGGKKAEFLKNFNFGPFGFLWIADLNESEFNSSYLDLTGSFETIENAYEKNGPFTPISPLSMHYQTTCRIVRGKTHEYLFMMQSSTKNIKTQNVVNIIDPLSDQLKSIKIDDFAKEQEIFTKDDDDVENLIDSETVDQIIFVNLDESKSMLNDIDDEFIIPKSDGDHRITIAIQYLTTFMDKISDYCLSCVQGLVSFNNNIEIRCPLCSNIDDFENKGLMNICPKSTPKLWDSIIFSCNEIVKFKKEKFENASSRIIVISSGEDHKSESKVEDVLKELIKNKIVVDSIILNENDDQNNDEKMLCGICHATGGFSFKINDFDEDLSIFENDAFLDIKKRRLSNDPLIRGDKSTRPSRLKVENITEEFMKKLERNAVFDTQIINIDNLHASHSGRLATPRHICAVNRDSILPKKRQRRIIREIFYAMQVTDSKSINFDPDIKIFIMCARLDRWLVFLRSNKNSIYGQKWWNLYVTFPDLYPVKPPHFKFITVPYHINVSQDGVINSKVFDKDYFSTDFVVDMIKQIKDLFLEPNLKSPNQISIYEMYISNKKMYEKFARDSAKSNAKDDYDCFIDKTYADSFPPIDDEVPPDFDISDIFTNKIPNYMVPGRRIAQNTNDMVLASSGVYYNKKELKELVTNRNPPICIVTGKILTEKPEDFDNI